MKPASLVNRGNACWLNTLLQVLMSCESVVNYSTSHSDDLSTYLLILLRGNDVASRIANELRLRLVMRDCPMVNMLTGGQECIREGLNLMLSATDDTFGDLFLVRMSIRRQCSACGACKTDDPCKSMYIDINKSMTETEMAAHVKSSSCVLDGYKCPRCECISTTRQEYRLTRTPPVLILNYSEKKRLDFPQSFKIKGREFDFRYELVGQVEHMGGAYGGHYYANVSRNDEVWRVDDTSITPSGYSATGDTTMLFYQRYSFPKGVL